MAPSTLLSARWIHKFTSSDCIACFRCRLVWNNRCSPIQQKTCWRSCFLESTYSKLLLVRCYCRQAAECRCSITQPAQHFHLEAWQGVCEAAHAQALCLYPGVIESWGILLASTNLLLELSFPPRVLQDSGRDSLIHSFLLVHSIW